MIYHRYDPIKDTSLCGRKLSKDFFGFPFYDSYKEHCKICEEIAAMPVSQGDDGASKTPEEVSITSTGAK